MAKEPGTQVSDRNDDLKQQWKAGPADPDRLADERKDRERLRSERAVYDPDKIAALKVERAKLIDDFNSETHDRYVKFIDERKRIDGDISKAGGNMPNVASEPYPTNETMADGTSRARLKVA